MKKRFLKFNIYFLMFISLIFPNIVSAKTVTFKGYNIGDKITIILNKEKNIEGTFYVISETPSYTEYTENDSYTKRDEDYQYVTAIYESSIGESIFSNSNAITKYTLSTLKTNLLNRIENLDWINYEEVRLLSKNDLVNITGSTSNSDISKQISEKYNWLMLDKAYWLSEDSYTIGTTCASSSCATEKIVANVISNGNYTYIDQNTSNQIRPVIEIHKEYVKDAITYLENIDESSNQEEKTCPNDSSISIQDCIDENHTSEECIKSLCDSNDIENPKTGIYVSLIAILCVISGLCYCIFTKKSYFSKIK